MNSKNMKQHTSSGTSERQKLNKSSQLLTQEENEKLFGLLGRKCQSLCTAVIQIYKTEGTAHSHWKKKHTAVLCLVKDSSKRSYFLRAYCMIKNELCWEHELYDSMHITKARPFLITFEGQDGHVALNFASEEECDTFYRITEFTIDSRNRKRQEKRSRPKSQVAPVIPPSKPPRVLEPEDSSKVALRNHPNVGSIQLTSSPKATFPASFGLSSSKDKKKATRKYTKADISTPMNFVHVSHVGWDAQKGFDLTGNENDEMLKHFFNKAGVSEHELNDRDTRAFIYDFITSNNVLESVKSEQEDKPKEPEVVAAAPAPPPVPSRHQTHNGTQRTAPPPPPARQPPPPIPTTAPPPPRGQAPPVRPPPIRVNTPPAQTAPPPPPPPPPSAPAPPPPPPMPMQTEAPLTARNELKPPSSLPVINDVRSELMESIRKGTTLRKIDPATLSTGSGDSRSELMSEIRQGIELRPASTRELSANRFSDGAAGGTDALADALRRALQERGRVIQSSDDDSDDSSENDGEWED